MFYLGILPQFSHLGKYSLSLENHWNIYQCWYNCNNLAILGNVFIHWKINGIVIIVYQLWYTRKKFPTLESAGIHWKIIGIFLYFNNLDALEELGNTMSSS